MFEKREEILYTRVKKSNKNFVAKVALENSVSESIVMDYFLDCIQAGKFKIELGKQNACKKKSSSKCAKKV
jgi:hypothetical protein